MQPVEIQSVSHLPNISPEERQAIPKLHLLPCEIHHTGKADVNKYFQVTPASKDPAPANEAPTKFASTFRGRALQGVRVSVPDGYKGVVYRESMTGKRVWKIDEQFDSFVVWGHDEVPGPSKDEFLKAVNWLQIAEDLHGDPDTSS
ncbi:Ribonuclease H2 subunit C [Quaeritorhiza haematococci]|nr:Ribonuclease H2 subunit C [Quaeritorhiza haematococci]